MIVALCVLSCIVFFLAIALLAVYVQIILPLQHELRQTQAKQAEHEDTIRRNAGATVGLYFVNRREINDLAESLFSQDQKLAFVESYLPEADRRLLACDAAPATQRNPNDCPETKRTNR